MSTTTAEVQEQHLSKEEIEQLAHPKRPLRQRIGVVASYVGMGLIVLYCIIPFYWMVVSAFRDPSEGRSTEFIPSPASIENFKSVFSATNNFGRSLLNSVIVAGTTTILVLVFGIIGAYALARLRFRGKVAVLWLIMACSMFPLVVLLPPLLKMFSSTSPFTWFPYWINTYQSVILPGLSFGLPLAVWTLTAFFKQLPVELEQAAMVDGSTVWGAFARIVLPIALPGLTAAFILSIVICWNEYFFSALLTSTNAKTLPVLVASQTGSQGINWWVMAAVATAAIAPLAIIGIILERYIVKGLTAGSVK